jgi:hypothetical protein
VGFADESPKSAPFLRCPDNLFDARHSGRRALGHPGDALDRGLVLSDSFYFTSMIATGQGLPPTLTLNHQPVSSSRLFSLSFLSGLSSRRSCSCSGPSSAVSSGPESKRSKKSRGKSRGRVARFLQRADDQVGDGSHNCAGRDGDQPSPDDSSCDTPLDSRSTHGRP